MAYVVYGGKHFSDAGGMSRKSKTFGCELTVEDLEMFLNTQVRNQAWRTRAEI